MSDISDIHEKTVTAVLSSVKEGKKFDSGKAPMSIIPRIGLEMTAAVFGFGAKKYGRNNYKAGMDWTRLIDAGMRHLAAIADGEDTDPESGLPHWAHVCANMMMLGFYQKNNRGKDDR